MSVTLLLLILPNSPIKVKQNVKLCKKEYMFYIETIPCLTFLFYTPITRRFYNKKGIIVITIPFILMRPLSLIFYNSHQVIYYYNI